MMQINLTSTDSPAILDEPMAGWQDWLALLKPRVMTLVVFTGVIGLVLAPGHLNPVLGFAAILCIATGAGAAGAINMWYDRDIDLVMRRTANRPIPSGRIAADEALSFGVMLAMASVLTMALATNMIAATILAGSIVFYVFIYTMWLKRRTVQNIVIGGAAGAFPPLIGWAAVTGNVGLLPALMFLTVFVWTPPHFWSLSLYACGDYQRAGVPMLPVVNGAKSTRRHILSYTVALVFVSLLPWAFGLAGLAYGMVAGMLGVGFLVHGWRVVADGSGVDGASMTKDAPARGAFRYSLAYLAMLFSALAIDRYLG